MTIRARRFLVVPDATFDDATMVSVTPFSGNIRQEAGPQVAQPTRSATATPEGDIAMTLSGQPETHVQGQARCTRAGVVEDARWGWLRDGDDPDTDLQLRQSPHVVGRRPDMIQQFINGASAYTKHAVRPKLHSLISGDLLMVWTTRIWDPIWARTVGTIAPAGGEPIYVCVLDHETDTWDTPDATLVVPFDLTGANYYVSAVDVTQYPDTGEIIMCVATSAHMVTGVADPRILWVYQSTDNAASWVLKHRLHFDGDIPDILLDKDGDGDSDDPGAWQDWALELLDSGRLCLFGCTEDNTWSLTSDDRGASWSPTLVVDHDAAFTYAGHGVGSSKARNGMGCFMSALRRINDEGTTRVIMHLSRDGVSFSEGIPVKTGRGECCDITIAISPDGWPHVYGTVHASAIDGDTAENVQDWLWGRRLKSRDPVLSDTYDSLLPVGAPGPNQPIGPPGAFHCSNGTPLGSYAVPSGMDPIDPTVYHGFTGLDAVLYRGQIVLATVALREGPQEVTYAQAEMYGFGLMVYRLNHWQPIQERVNNVYQLVGATPVWLPSWPALGRVYNETWDCYDHPNFWGYTLTGTGGSFTVGGPHGGYFKINEAPSFFTRAVTSNTPVGLTASLRIIVHLESGGSVGNDDTGARLIISDGVDNTDVSIRFERTGADLKIALRDNVAGAAVGVTITIDGTGWAEVLYAQHEEALGVVSYLFARPYPRTTDPDWDEPYTEGASGDEIDKTAGLQNSFSWGQKNSGTRESWWKGVHLSRAYEGTEDDGALVQHGITYIDNDAVNDRTTTGTGEPPLDNCLDNWMRTCRAISTPPMFMCRGDHATFRGEAVNEGNWDYTTAYAFAAANVQIQPVMREWRSVDEETVLYMVFRAPDGRTFRPDAVAVFGSNCAAFAFNFNNTDVWTSPAAGFSMGIPPFYNLDRYIHEWAIDLTVNPGNALSATGNRVTVAGMSPWRPHQFKSDAGGQSHYVALQADGTFIPQVFRIIDNTSNTLILQTDVDTTGITLEGSGAIFSDRFAVMIGHHFPANPLTGYEYCQVVVASAKHWDADGGFSRIGRIVLGMAVEISQPDVEKGWSTAFESGAVLVPQATGADYSHRLRPIIRTWQADRPWMMPPEEADAVYVSPGEQPVRATWAQWVDVMRRIDGDGTACALVWEGERFVGFTGEERVQVCSDPLHLAMCHVVGLGDLEQLEYTGVMENLAEGQTCVPRPVAHIRGLRFKETL